MLSKIRRQVSFANVAAALALFVALGGTAWALERNSVGSRHIANNQIRSVDIRNEGIRSIDIRDGQVGSRDIRDGQIRSRDIRDGQVGSRDIRDGQIRSRDIRDDGIRGRDVAEATLRGFEFGNGGIHISRSGFLPPGDGGTIVGMLEGDLNVECDASPQLVYGDVDGGTGDPTHLFVLNGDAGPEVLEVADGAAQVIDTQTAAGTDDFETAHLQAYGPVSSFTATFSIRFDAGRNECQVVVAASNEPVQAAAAARAGVDAERLRARKRRMERSANRGVLRR